MSTSRGQSPSRPIGPAWQRGFSGCSACSKPTTPFRQKQTARGIRRSPFHARLAADRAFCGEVAGPDNAVTLAGLHAVDGCRAETGFRHFGHDITCEDHVPEAGLGFTVKTGKGDFIGRDAVLRRREDGLDQRLVRFLPADPEPLACHDDPNLRDEQIVGHLASGAYGHHLGAAVGLGHVPCTRERAESLPASRYESKWPARASRRRPRSRRCTTRGGARLQT